MVLASKLLPHIDARDRQPDDRSQNGAGPNEKQTELCFFFKKKIDAKVVSQQSSRVGQRVKWRGTRKYPVGASARR